MFDVLGFKFGDGRRFIVLRAGGKREALGWRNHGGLRWRRHQGVLILHPSRPAHHQAAQKNHDE